MNNYYHYPDIKLGSNTFLCKENLYPTYGNWSIYKNGEKIVKQLINYAEAVANKEVEFSAEKVLTILPTDFLLKVPTTYEEVLYIIREHYRLPLQSDAVITDEDIESIKLDLRWLLICIVDEKSNNLKPINIIDTFFKNDLYSISLTEEELSTECYIINIPVNIETCNLLYYNSESNPYKLYCIELFTGGILSSEDGSIEKLMEWSFYYTINGKIPIPGTSYTYKVEKRHDWSADYFSYFLPTNECIYTIIGIAENKEKNIFYKTNVLQYEFTYTTEEPTLKFIKDINSDIAYSTDQFANITAEKYESTANNISPIEYLNNELRLVVNTKDHTFSIYDWVDENNSGDNCKYTINPSLPFIGNYLIGSEWQTCTNSVPFEEGFIFYSKEFNYGEHFDDYATMKCQYVNTNYDRIEGNYWDIKLDFDIFNNDDDTLNLKIICSNKNVTFKYIIYGGDNVIYDYNKCININNDHNLNNRYLAIVGILDNKLQTIYYDNIIDNYKDWYKHQSMGTLTYNISNSELFDNHIIEPRIASSIKLSLNNPSITSLNSLFYDRYYYNAEIIDVNELNTSNINNMVDVFCLCSNAKKIILDNWNVSKCHKFTNMFRDCTSLQELDLSKWQTTVLTAEKMFYRCSNIKYLDLSGLDFTGSTVDDMFYNCYSLRYIKVNSSIFTATGLDFSQAKNLGVSNGHANRWILHISEIIPEVSAGNLRLPNKLKTCTDAYIYISIINNKGWTIL